MPQTGFSIAELDKPILQAPMGGVASPALAAVVSNAGGMGSLGLTWTEPEFAVQQVRALKNATDNPFFINFVLSFPALALDAVLAEGVPAISFSWGQPGTLVDKVKRSGAQVGVQVGTLEGAKEALDDGADFIVCQGFEAGGHVQSSMPLEDFLSAVVKLADGVPVVAAGGLANGADLARVKRLGASAAMYGTRFVATVESGAHAVYKQAIVDASETAYTACFDGGWPYAAHRVLRNNTLRAWEAAGCPPSGERPGEHEVVAIGEGFEVQRYDDTPPMARMSGDLLDCCLYAGTGCRNIHDIPTVNELMSRIMAESRASDTPTSDC